LIALVTHLGAAAVFAQDLRGFVAGGVTSESNHQQFPSAGGGVLVNVGQPWISAGAQAETFWQWPYFAGRGTLFAQGNLLTRGRLRPFLLGGVGFGEAAGPMIGAGVEIRPTSGRHGLRVSVEDYLLRLHGLPCQSFGLQSYCDSNPRQANGSVEHRMALRVGVLF
jgi:hypothetical protein